MNISTFSKIFPNYFRSKFEKNCFIPLYYGKIAQKIFHSTTLVQLYFDFEQYFTPFLFRIAI
jgi:hypothetical protein